MTEEQLQDLMEVLDHDQETGIFTWSEAVALRVKPGDIAGTIRKDNGVVEIKVKNKIYKAHRLAVAFVRGHLEDHEPVIHIDGNRTNNSYTNLKIVSRRTLCRTSTIQHTNTSGIKGVNYDKSKHKWIVRLGDGSGGTIMVGRYKTKEEAVAARVEAEARLWE